MCPAQQEIAELLEAIEKETCERIAEEKAQAAKARSLTDGQLYLAGWRLPACNASCSSRERRAKGQRQNSVVIAADKQASGAQHCHGASRSSTETTTQHLSAPRCQSHKSRPKRVHRGRASERLTSADRKPVGPATSNYSLSAFPAIMANGTIRVIRLGSGSTEFKKLRGCARRD